MKRAMQVIVTKDFSDLMKEDKRLYSLEDGEEKYYNHLGTACGVGLSHCLILAEKHRESFWERVFAFKELEKDEAAEKSAKILEEMSGHKYIIIQFYELS